MIRGNLWQEIKSTKEKFVSIFYSFNRKYYEFIMTRTSYIEYYLLSFHFIYENGYFRITIFKRK